MGRDGVAVRALVGELTGEGVITKNVGDFAGTGLFVAVLLVAEMMGCGEGVDVPTLILGVAVGTGAEGLRVGWLRTNKATAPNAENEPAIRYQRALTTYL
jgi:hypothetical protein